MSRLLALVAVLGLVVATAADDKPKADPPKKVDPPKKPEPTLKVGDPAPSLTADKWLQGTPVKTFSPGNVYVVEFWATWCGPCIVMMPHMAEMQEEYRDRGVTFIGYSAKDPGNTAEKVAAFVEKRGPKLKYTFAYADNRDTYDAWMKAAGQNGIPCSFVVDQKGKIAYIGHPMYLDLVLPKVVGGTWSEADVKKMEAVEKDVNAVFAAFPRQNADDAAVEKALKALTEFESKYPVLAHIPYFISPKLSLLIKAKRVDDAKKMAAAVTEKAKKQSDPMALRSVAMGLLPAVTTQKDLGPVALNAALAGLELAGDKDLGSLLNVAEVYFATGDAAKAREYGEKAVAAAEPRQKAAVEQRVKKYAEKDEKKEEKKDKP